MSNQLSRGSNVTTTVLTNEIDVMNKLSVGLAGGQFSCYDFRHKLSKLNNQLLFSFLLPLFILKRQYHVSWRSISGFHLKVMVKGRWLCTDEALSLQH